MNSAKDHTSRRARVEGKKDSTVKADIRYNTSSIIKGVADVYRKVTGQDKPAPKPKPKR